MTSRGSDSSIESIASDPTVYQVPVKASSDETIRANFQRTVVDGVPRDRLADLCEIPLGHEQLRVWGNTESNAAETGDYLLFADRDGRYGGDYTLLARVAHATVLDPDTSRAFTDRIGWGENPSDSYPHVMFLEPIYDARLDREAFWDVLGFSGWPNDTFSAINFGRRDSTFFSEYDSVPAFIEEIRGERLYPADPDDPHEELETDGSSPAGTIDHPISTHIRDAKPTVYAFTAPADYWLTAVAYGAVSFHDKHRDRWTDLSSGDVVFLHAQADPGDEKLSTHAGGIIGVGILGTRFEKDERWWRDEYEHDEMQSLAVSFDRLFLTGATDEIDASQSIADKSLDTIDREVGALLTDSLSIKRANERCSAVAGTGFPAQSMHSTFRDGDGGVDRDRPLALVDTMAETLTETTTINVHESYRGSIPADTLEGLYFPNGQGDRILEQIETVLRTGKHVLLTGPPGTGKTEIARRICSQLAEEHPYLYSGYETTTATADWSTFDTVGGYMPAESAESGGEDLAFTPGIVLNRLKNSQTGTQSNELVVIDELNRADIDKAFGQLFTLLSGQSVQLPYTKDGREVELTTSADEAGLPASHQFVVPDSWRIFATMNTYDKTSLYEMSYAFMRRFAFVRVPAPELPAGRTEDAETHLERIVHEYASAWDLDLDRDVAMAVGRVWRETNHAVDERAIGPAIIEDILRYVTHHPDSRLEYHLTQAVISYVFPQLEGVPKRRKIVREIAAVQEIDSALLERAASEMLQVTLTESDAV